MYVKMEKPIVENTVMEQRKDKNGKIKSYRIVPKKGFKLHEITRDEEICDEVGNPTGKVRLGFTKGIITTGGSYDYEKNEREIYAIKE